MLITLESDRLLLRPLVSGDEEMMFRNWTNDPEVCRFLSWEPHGDISVTRAFLNYSLERYNDPKTIRFGIVHKPDGQLIGTIDVIEFFEGEAVEIGYCMGKAYWGKGIMTEAVGLVAAKLKELGYSRLRIVAAVANIGSNRVAQKNGLALICTEKREMRRKPGVIYEVNVYEKEI